MEENLHDIDKLFKSAIEDHSETPPASVWDAIDNTLDKSNVIHISRKYSRLKRVSILLLILLTGIIAYEINTHHSTGETVKKEKVIVPGKARPTSYTADSVHNLVSGSAPSSTSVNATAANKLPANAVNDSIGNKVNNHYNPNIHSNPSINKSTALLATGNNLHNKSSRTKITVLQPDMIINDNNPLVPDVKVQLYMNPINTTSLTDLTSNNKPIREVTAPVHFQIHPIPVPEPVTGATTSSKSVSRSHSASKQRKISLTPFISPEFSFYSLQNDHPHGREDDRHEIKNNEKQELSSSAGLFIEYALNSRISLVSGITLASSKIGSGEKNVYAEPDNSGNVKFRVAGSCGVVYVSPHNTTPPHIGDSLKAATINTLHYLEIPIAIKYSLGNKKMNFIGLAGLSTNLLTQGSIITTLDNGISKESQTSTTVEGLKKIYLSGILSAGASYNLSSRISLVFIPTFKIAITSINNGAAVKSYPSSFGLTAGLQIKL